MQVIQPENLTEKQTLALLDWTISQGLVNIPPYRREYMAMEFDENPCMVRDNLRRLLENAGILLEEEVEVKAPTRWDSERTVMQKGVVIPNQLVLEPRVYVPEDSATASLINSIKGTVRVSHDAQNPLRVLVNYHGMNFREEFNFDSAGSVYAIAIRNGADFPRYQLNGTTVEVDSSFLETLISKLGRGVLGKQVLQVCSEENLGLYTVREMERAQGIAGLLEKGYFGIVDPTAGKILEYNSLEPVIEAAARTQHPKERLDVRLI